MLLLLPALLTLRNPHLMQSRPSTISLRGHTALSSNPPPMSQTTANQSLISPVVGHPAHFGGDAVWGTLFLVLLPTGTCL